MEPFLAQIILFGGNFAIRGWAPCDGRLLSIAQNTALFSLLGTTYGGDGKVTFALPKLDNVGESIYLIALQGIYPSRG
ncbi:MAG: tail fiber protein [Burkholderiales bacterium]|nr:tail fiber protein [Burkholderiales bacterium]